MDGYISLHRQIIDSAVFASPNYLKIWVWLLIKANYKPKPISIKTGGGETIVDINRGQLIFGRHKAEEELGLSGSMIYRTLQKFQQWNMITIESNNQYSLVTICKYNDYQNESKESEQPMNSERTASEPDLTYERTASEQRVNTSNKDNKDNNKRETPNDFKKTNTTIEECRQYAQMAGHNPMYGERYFHMRNANDWMIPRGKEGMLYPITNVRSDYTNCYNRGYLDTSSNKPEQQKIVDGGVFQ
jgi:hypothetical protein